MSHFNLIYLNWCIDGSLYPNIYKYIAMLDLLPTQLGCHPREQILDILLLYTRASHHQYILYIYIFRRISVLIVPPRTDHQN